ncbi:MAG: MBL fold metallo-hydrolase [Chloroflexi bacterium]|nr:MBL fold metallo-hydrolase [Chloroflexota bacterium]
MSEKPQSYAPGLYGVIGPGVNIYVLDDGDAGLTVVDAGMPGSTDSVLDLIRALGRAPSDVKHILITHADLDHIGGLKALVEATGAPVVASAASAPYIRSRKTPPHMPFPLSIFTSVATRFMRKPAPVDQIVSDGERLAIAGGIRVIATPGHTPDHVSFYWERENVLLAGDLLNNRSGLALTPQRITHDQDAARASARKALALQPAVIACGHGPVWLAAQNPGGIEALLASFEPG